MKEQANGALNVSTLDGWWDEAWQMGMDSGAEVGWAIGKGEFYEDPGYQDQVEAAPGATDSEARCACRKAPFWVTPCASCPITLKQ